MAEEKDLRLPHHGDEVDEQAKMLPELFKDGAAFSEVNLLKHPFNLLSENNLKELLQEAAKTQKSHIYCEVKDKQGVVRVWTVKPNIVSGYTRPFDKKVLIAVMKLVSAEDFPPPMVWKLGALSRICKALKINDSGKNMKAVKESLIRISDSVIYTEGFYLKGTKEYWSEERKHSALENDKAAVKGGNFTVWSVFWKGKRLPDSRIADCIYLVFNIPFYVSLSDYYVKPIDYDYWLNLSPLAQRLYEITGIKFYGLKDSDYVRYEYAELCQVMPIEKQKYFANAKQVLDRAHAILIKTSWFEQVEWEGISSDSQSWAVRYYPGWRAKEETRQAKERLNKFRLTEQYRERDVLHKSRELPLYDAEAEAKRKSLVHELLMTLGNSANEPYYKKLARLIARGKIPEHVFWEALSTTKYEAHRGAVQNKSAYFTHILKVALRERGIEFEKIWN